MSKYIKITKIKWLENKWRLYVLMVYPFRAFEFPVSMLDNNRRSAVDILRERYARGEIEEVEFHQRRQDLVR